MIDISLDRMTDINTDNKKQRCKNKNNTRPLNSVGVSKGINNGNLLVGL